MSLLTATLESTADGILVISSEGKIAGLNDQFLRMWGIPPELLEADIGRTCMRVILGQVTDPDLSLPGSTELTTNPGAESHDVMDFIDGRTFERYSRPQKVGEDCGPGLEFPRRHPAAEGPGAGAAGHADLAAQAEQLRAMAFQDPLTGLANRAVFNDGLVRRADASRGSSPWTSSCWTWTTSRRSTTSSATRPATTCWWRWPAGCAAASPPRTWWPGWAATSLWCC